MNAHEHVKRRAGGLAQVHCDERALEQLRRARVRLLQCVGIRVGLRSARHINRHIRGWRVAGWRRRCRRRPLVAIRLLPHLRVGLRGKKRRNQYQRQKSKTCWRARCSCEKHFALAHHKKRLARHPAFALFSGTGTLACAPLLSRNPSDLGFRPKSHPLIVRGQLKPVSLEPPRHRQDCLCYLKTHNGDSPMAQMQNSQSVALQLEKVRDKLPLLYERDDILLTMIQQRGDVERVSSRNMRLPLQIRPGGKAGLANMDGGDLGRGSGTVYDVAQVTPVFFRHAVEITKLVEYASNAPEKAIENAAKREVKNAMAQFRAFLDTGIQTNGNGVLGTITSVPTTGLPAGVAAQFAMAKPPGAQLVYFNQTIQVYDPTLTTNRGSANVVLVDPFNSFIQLDALPAGTAANDV